MSADSIDEAICPELMQSYCNQKPDFFTTTGQPGHVKLEFHFNSQHNWQFVSGMTQNYALLTNDDKLNVHKNSALSRISSNLSYRVSCAILDKQHIVVPQLRRTHKLLNTNVKRQDFNFN